MYRILTAPLIALLASAACAEPGFFDTFDSPGATAGDDANDPRDLGFHAMQGAPALEVRQVEGRGGMLAASLSVGGSSRNIYASQSFQSVPLAPITEVTLGFSIRATGRPGQGLPNFAFGLHHSSYSEVVDDTIGSYINSLDDRGYFLNLSAGGESSVQTDFSGQRLDVESGRTIDPFNFADGAWHDYRLVLRDDGDASFFAFDLYINDQFHATDGFLPGGIFLFDTVHFGLTDGAMDMELDDIFVSVAVVPPPGVLALLTVGVGTAAGRRRR